MDIQYFLDKRSTARKQQLMDDDQHKQASLSQLFEQQQQWISRFINSDFVQQFSAETAKDNQKLQATLDCLQVFSDAFQRLIMLRYAMARHPQSEDLAFLHIHEEFGHNYQLLAEREFRPTLFDPILDALTSWFCWKIFAYGPAEKVVMINMVLEEASNQMTKVASQYIPTEISRYFSQHADADESHATMGLDLLEDLSVKTYAHLLQVHEQSWQIILEIVDRFCFLIHQHCKTKEVI